MTANVTSLNFYLTGGASNSDPDASLGGEKSSHLIGDPVVTYSTSAIPGVTAGHCGGFPSGEAHVLRYTASGNKLAVKNIDEGTFGADVTISADGVYEVRALDKGSIRVTVVAASLPGSDQSKEFFVIPPTNNLFDNVSSAENTAGKVEYRCLFLMNDNASEGFDSVQVYLRSPSPAGDVLALGAEDTPGDGTSSGVPGVIANEAVAPTGITFVETISLPAGGLRLGPLGPLEGIGVWVRRTVSPGAVTDELTDDFSVIGIAAIPTP